MAIIDFVVIFLIILFIFSLLTKKKKKYESYEDDQGYSSQFVYSAGRIKSETPEEKVLDDYNSAYAIRRRRQRQDQLEQDLLLQREAEYSQSYDYSAPSYTQPTIPTRPTIPRPPVADFTPVEPQPQPQPIPSYGQIKQEEEVDTQKYSNVGKAIKKKRKLG